MSDTTAITIYCDNCHAQKVWTITGDAHRLHWWRSACRAELTMLGWLVDKFGATCGDCMHGLAHWIAQATAPARRN